MYDAGIGTLYDIVPSVPNNILVIGGKKLKIVGGLNINVEKASGTGDNLNPINRQWEDFLV